MFRSHMYHRNVNMFLNNKRVYEDAAGAAGDKGDAGKGAAGEKGAEETVSKGEYEKVLGELEGLRGEVLSPEYLEFLQAKDKPKVEAPKTDDKGGELIYGLSSAQIEAMSKADLAKHIAKSVKEEASKEITRVRDEMTSGEKEQVKKEISAFARSHGDFDKYRPAMHGLSLDPKNADLTLGELYAKAKEMYPTGPTKEEKEKAAKLKGEHPGGDNESYDRLKKMTPDEVAKEAMKETKEKLGIESFPSA